MADSWLDVGEVATALGSSLAEVVDEDALQFWCDTVRDYVEDRRADLVTGDPPAFAATPRIVGGAALLAYRLYQRRTAPLGTVATSEAIGTILRDDPDVARMLGIGRHRRFRFGAPRPAETAV